MTVTELIAALQSMPPNAVVSHLWDGEARTIINLLWLARDGTVVTSDYGMTCYSDGTRPWTAPLKADDIYWRTPSEIECAIQNDCLII